MTEQDMHELGGLAQAVQDLMDQLKLMKEELDLFKRLHGRHLKSTQKIVSAYDAYRARGAAPGQDEYQQLVAAINEVRHDK